MRAAAFGALFLLVTPTNAAAAEQQRSEQVQCDLALAVWTQFWNEAPRQSFNLVPGARDRMDCVWNTATDNSLTAAFTAATYSNGGRTAFLQASAVTLVHATTYHCTLTLVGDYWRSRECELVAVSD